MSYLSSGAMQSMANNFTSGCLNVTINRTTEGSAITLDKAYPISDSEGLDTTPYTFTIENQCSSSTNYGVYLESLNETANTLDAEYIKVSLSNSDIGTLTSILGNHSSSTPTITGAYASHELYSGTLNGNETKTFSLRIDLAASTIVSGHL